MPDTLLHQTRVILGATCFADAEPGLQIAVLLAQKIGAEIHGCLVADETVLAAVDVPHARSVSYSGRPLADLTAQTLQRAFRADARLFERQLLDAARRASLRSVFTEAQGPLPGVLEGIASTGDVIVFGVRRVMRPTARREAPLVLVTGATRPGQGLLTLAAGVSERLNTRLVVLVDESLREKVEGDLGTRANVTFEVRPTSGPRDLMAQLDRMSPAAVLIHPAASGMPPLAQLIETARCPVVMPLLPEV